MAFDQTQPAFVRLKSLCMKKTDKLLFFTGAGMSHWAGLPLWSDLKRALLTCLDKKAENMEISERKELRLAAQYIRQERNPWRSFQLLREKLGAASFRSAIRSELHESDQIIPPEAYTLLWKLNTAGILNLNLDQLAFRAFSLTKPGRPIEYFPGKLCPNHAHLVKGNKPFVANLHGTLSDAESWVLTSDDLASLLRKGGYSQFLQSCFLAHTVVFCGMSADDKAVGGFLESLRNVGIDSGEHYWFTSRNDSLTDEWAQERNIEPILYSDFNGDHSDFVEALKFLADAKPSEDDGIAPPITASVPMLGIVEIDRDYSPEELESQSPDFLRDYLNTKATEILTSNAPDRYERYFNFCDKYDAAIHTAWYVRPGSKHDSIFGYRFVKQIGEGSFGTIYEAVAPSGETVAVKLLHESIRSKPERIQAFRRGVASMQILETRNVSGTIPYKYAAEIPAFVVMDLIHGENLATAIAQYGLSTWPEILSVASKIIDILRRSHRLPEQVLHRDIRPQNIMIQNPWEAREDWDVVMLDFDLSWNRDATEKSIEDPGSTNGYLAPEMMYRDSNVSTRSALVDSFGLGMTLFFMRTTKDPKPLEALHVGWHESLREYTAKHRFEGWRSLPSRYFRLIGEATKKRQADRVDVSSIASEIEALEAASHSPRSVASPTMWAEELACISTGVPYQQDLENNSCIIQVGGLKVQICGREIESEVAVEFRWSQIGNEQYSGVKKWLPRARDQINAAMKLGGWEGHVANDGYFLDGRFIATIADLQRSKERYRRALEESIAACQLN